MSVAPRTFEHGRWKRNWPKSLILEGAARPGLVVNIVKDSNDSAPIGTIHTLIYSVSAEDNEGRGNLYTLQTAERSGSAFQATLQAARYNNAP